MGAKPCVRMLLGGAGFSGLGVAFMFPADAQPEREVPHTHGGSPRHPLSSLPGGRAPPEVFRENRLTRESPRAGRRGGFSSLCARFRGRDCLDPEIRRRKPAPPPAKGLHCNRSRHRSTTHSRNRCNHCNRGSATTTQPSSEYTEMHPQKRAYSFLSDFNTPVRSVFSLSIRSPSACAILSRRLSASDFSTAFPDEVSKHPAGFRIII